jgi:multidrug resistance protein, MATE family
MAKRYAKISQKIMMADIAFQIIIVLGLRYLIAEFYTDVVPVQDRVAEALIIVAFGQIFNQMQAAQQGIMRGLGQVYPAAIIAFISYYIFAMPLAWTFSFPTGLGLNGLWLGMYSGQFVLCSLYQYWFT